MISLLQQLQDTRVFVDPYFNHFSELKENLIKNIITRTKYSLKVSLLEFNCNNNINNNNDIQKPNRRVYWFFYDIFHAQPNPILAWVHASIKFSLNWLTLCELLVASIPSGMFLQRVFCWHLLGTSPQFFLVNPTEVSHQVRSGSSENFLGLLFPFLKVKQSTNVRQICIQQ